MNHDAEALARGARRLGQALLAEARDITRAYEQLAMTLVQEQSPAQLAGALAVTTLDAVMGAAASADGERNAAARRLCGSYQNEPPPLYRGPGLSEHGKGYNAGTRDMARAVLSVLVGETADEDLTTVGSTHLVAAAAGDQVPVAHIKGYADQLRADAAAADEDAVAVGLLRAADGLGDLVAATTTTGEDFATAGQPHPVAAARAQSAAEQLPTVGRWNTSPAAAADDVMQLVIEYGAECRTNGTLTDKAIALLERIRQAAARPQHEQGPGNPDRHA
ncbi:hypothetical protein AB0A95_33410 [Micromonospora sp. NPDC049230]|uniref:hypothetical protein n=1 Tax=Micromonospora sp. NPDC049230 TaxID=3155502 RepID=UPI0033F1B0FF